MKKGEKFTFYSDGKHKQALFLDKINEKIKCVVCNEENEIQIHENQIITQNQISMF
tara:strand:- start:556 stop:723 length:168 start_codon:yes stop_codon:yes gene_type:complete